MSQPVDAVPTEHCEQPRTATPNNIPLSPTPLIGREQEVERLCRSLLGPDVRLLTLTGPPGVGKTRLSLQVALMLLSSFSDGVYFTNLAPISDPGLVASEIARDLSVRETSGRASLESLKAYLRDKRMLLVLDNFEQVIEAAPVVAELAQTSAAVKLLVTSRMRLQLRGEQEFQVPPLSMPPLEQITPVEELVKYEAVRLFVERATAIKSDFVVTDRSAPAVTEICHRLDGLPLAIELAAARVKILPAQAMVLRLQSRSQFLTGGAHDLPPRQRTLRSAIAWSYDLLNSRDQLLFKRLAVFVGGRSLEAIEAVCNSDSRIGPDVLDSVSSLVDKSLLRQEENAGGEPRFVMLETLQEYAGERLEESGEGDDIRQLHAEYFMRMADQAEPHFTGPEEASWLVRLEEEHDNMRAALRWSLQSDDGGESALRLGASLARFWLVRGYLSEGREWLSRILSMPGKNRPVAARAKALERAGELAYVQSDYAYARPVYEEALSIYRSINDRRGVADTLANLAEVATEEGDYVSAVPLFEEGLTIMRELGVPRGAANALMNLGWVGLRTGDYANAAKPLEEALDLYRSIPDMRGTAFALSGLGETAMRLGDYPRASALFEESLLLRRQVGHKWGIAISLGTLGWVAIHRRDYRRATELLHESISLRNELGDIGGTAWCLERLADVSKAKGQPERTARLLGAAQVLREGVNSVIDPGDQPEHDRTAAEIRSQLGEEAFTAAWQEGRNMSLEQILAYARSSSTSDEEGAGLKEWASRIGTKADHGGLTDREAEVVALIAQSKSNGEIAEALVITKRTVETHIGNILSKLGFTSRGQIAAWAIKHGLVNDI